MKFLIDTNIFIPLEPTGLSEIEPGTLPVASLAQRLASAGQQLFLHPDTIEDIRRDANEERKRIREILFVKYPTLPSPPPIPQIIVDSFGEALPNTNDWVDNRLIAALYAECADYLVTEDREIHKKGRMLGLGDRVLTVAIASTIIADLFDDIPNPPPLVESLFAHQLNESDPVFSSLRGDYDGFDAWLVKCKREHRHAWVIRESNTSYGAVTIVKREDNQDYGHSGKTLKICTFKVSATCNGLRYGELLLKPIFKFAKANSYDNLYITVFPKHQQLIDLLVDFGFYDSGYRTSLGEIVLSKALTFTSTAYDELPPLDFNIKFGPLAVNLDFSPAFIIPIQPQYHSLLFPDIERQPLLLPLNKPFGNSIRKAYLSKSKIRSIRPGANIIFYRSYDVRGITCLGVVEDTMVLSNPEQIARYVGKRTVYSFHEMKRLCKEGQPILAILFRHALSLPKPIPFQELKSKGILSGVPQSIVTVDSKATGWFMGL